MTKDIATHVFLFLVYMMEIKGIRNPYITHRSHEYNQKSGEERMISEIRDVTKSQKCEIDDLTLNFL